MAQQFEDQGGAATSNPSAFMRWMTSMVGRRLMSQAAVDRRRGRAERARRRAGGPHRIEYFHQVEDGYSHLAAQLLRPLLDQYDVELVCHLVSVEHDENLPEPELLLPLSRLDSSRVAPHYGLRFPEAVAAPAPETVARAEGILAASTPKDFPDLAASVGDALWSGDTAALAELESRHGTCNASDTAAKVRQGSERRTELGHYSAAMFHYGGEWYWGADRFYELERTLIGYGARSDGADELICPRPPVETGPRRDDGSLTLEFYPSLRSPYTSIIFDETVELATETGVSLEVRPVLPMVMRGVPATRRKGMYIFSDTAREARAKGLDWGRLYDPIGEPTRNCYSLYPWARERGRGTELLSSFLHAAFFDGVNTNNDRGMRIVVEKAGLPWAEAKTVMGNRDWEHEIEQNRLAMYAFGSWGVPSYRLLDAKGKPVVGLWGQDRLWLFAREIQRLLADRDS